MDDQEPVKTPRMDTHFYSGVESLLSRPPPKFDGMGKAGSSKEADAIVRKNKQALRRMRAPCCSC